MVYMGTLGQENGPDVAIEALALVKQKFPDANLHVIGGIEKETTWLKKLLKKYIRKVSYFLRICFK